MAKRSAGSGPLNTLSGPDCSDGVGLHPIKPIDTMAGAELRSVSGGTRLIISSKIWAASQGRATRLSVSTMTAITSRAIVVGPLVKNKLATERAAFVL